MAEDVLKKAKETRAALDEMIERGKQVLAKKAADDEAAIKARRETVKEKVGTDVVDMAVVREEYCHATGRTYSKNAVNATA